MRLRLLAPAFAFVTLGAPCASAQDAPAPGSFDAPSAIRTFLTDAAGLGADEATVGAVTQRGDTVNVANVAMRWAWTFSAAEKPVTLTVNVTLPTLDVTRLAHEGGRFSAERIAMPEIRFNLGVEGAPDPLSYDLTARDYVIEAVDWAPLPRIEANAAAPVSRFAPLLDWSVDQSYRRLAIGAISGTVAGSGQTQDIAYGPVDIGPVAKGRLGSFSYGAMTSTQTAMMPDATGEQVPTTVTVNYGASRGTGFNLAPVVSLFTGTNPGEGPQTVVESTTVDGINMTFGNMATVAMGPNTVENLTIDASRGPLMTQIDGFLVSAMNDEEPEPAKLMSFLLDVYGAFGVDRYTLADIAATFPDGSARLGEFLIEGLSAEGIDTVAVNAVGFDAQGATGTLGSFELSGFVFPERTAFLNAVMGGMAGMQPDVPTILSALPYLGRMTLREASLTSPGMADLKLGLYETRLENYINAIPTRITLALQGLEMPLAMVPDPMTQMMFQSLNADPIRADGTVSLAWDSDSERVELANDITVGGVGKLTADAALGGIPQLVFEDPTRLQEAMATAALVGLTARFDDQGVTDFLLGMVADQSGMSKEDFATAIAQQAAVQVSMVTGDAALGEQISGALSTYMNNPQSLTIAATPAAPVAIAQIVGAAMTSPQALPSLLNFSLTANQ